jgi:transcription initiation factor TFIIB
MDDSFFQSVQPRDAEGAKYQQLTERQKLDLNVKLMCPYCRDPVPNLIEDFKQGDLICGNCGTVFKDRIIDTRSEWRTFSSDEGGDDPSRVGGAENKLLSGRMSMETVISMKDGGKGTAKELLKTHAKQSSIRNERMILQAFKDIAALGERMGLQRLVIDSGRQYFKLAEERQLVHKGKTEIVAAGTFLTFLPCHYAHHA